MSLLNDSNLFSVPDKRNDLVEALTNREDSTRVAPTDGDNSLGFGIQFYVTKTGQVLVQFDVPPPHDLEEYPEILGQFMYSLTSGEMNEICFNSFLELIGDCPFVTATMEKWHTQIENVSTPPTGPIVKPGQTFEGMSYAQSQGQ